MARITYAEYREAEQAALDAESVLESIEESHPRYETVRRIVRSRRQRAIDLLDALDEPDALEAFAAAVARLDPLEVHAALEAAEVSK